MRVFDVFSHAAPSTVPNCAHEFLTASSSFSCLPFAQCEYDLSVILIELASTSEISAVKALFGEIQNHATLPITLPDIAPRGFSLSWPVAPAQPVSAQVAP
jgi:hypothetical protein